MSFLRAVRKERNMTQREVSERAGISQPAYCNIENEERKPSVEMAKRIGAVLGFNWTRFFEENWDSA